MRPLARLRQPQRRSLSFSALTGLGSPEKRSNAAPRFHVGVVVVPQQIAWVIERLGKFEKVLDPGIHFLAPRFF